MQRPAPSEYQEYYEMYVRRVPAGADVLAALRGQRDEAAALLADLDDGQAAHRYAPDKWSVKEVIGHVLDAERAFAFRALAFARADPAPIPGLEQDAWARNAGYDARPVSDLAREYAAVRASSLALFGSFDEAATRRTGVASDATFSVRALVFVVAGHERHHLDVLRERYL